MADEYVRLYDSFGTELPAKGKILDVEQLEDVDPAETDSNYYTNTEDDRDFNGLGVSEGGLRLFNFTRFKNGILNAVSTAISQLNTAKNRFLVWWNGDGTESNPGVITSVNTAIGDAIEATNYANTQAEAARQAAADRTIPQLVNIPASTKDASELFVTLLDTVLKKMTPQQAMSLMLSKLNPTDFIASDYVVGTNSNMAPKIGSLSSLAAVVSGMAPYRRYYYFNAGASDKYYHIATVDNRLSVCLFVGFYGYNHLTAHLINLSYISPDQYIRAKTKLAGVDIDIYGVLDGNSTKIYLRGYHTDTKVTIFTLTTGVSFPEYTSGEVPPSETDLIPDFTI